MPVANELRLGRNVRILHPPLVNLYDCVIGDETPIGTFVEIQAGATVGSRCKISSHSFICEGVTIEDEVFIGHGVMFTNDRFPARPRTRVDRKARTTGRLKAPELVVECQSVQTPPSHAASASERARRSVRAPS
jgi:UDP-3-O-[3-hydroxymyristoyl] glucosamine N-acyltransferase